MLSTKLLKFAITQWPIWLMVGLLIGLGPMASAQDYEGPRMTYSYDGPPVSFQQIYDNPNDGRLNLNYARQQSARGDLLGAAAALERLLYNQPNWHSARLFYAAVLYRLDDKAAAAREMQLLEGRNLNSDQLLLYQDYSQAFELAPPETAAAALDGRAIKQVGSSENEIRPSAIRSSSNIFQGRVALAARADNNAGNALTDLGISSQKRSDNSLIAQGALRATFPIGKNTQIRGFGNINGQVRRHETFSQSDYNTVGASLGVFREFGNKRLSAELKADRVDISEEPYLNQFGPKVSLAIKTDNDARIDLSAAIYNQDFDNLSFANGEEQRSGNKTVILANITKRLNANLTLGVNGGAEVKDAKVKNLSYSAIRLGGQAEYALEGGVTLKARLNMRKINYDGTPIQNRSDREDRVNLRLSASTPISTFIGDAANSDTVSPVSVEAALNFNNRNFGDSTLNSNRDDYNNAGAEIRLTWDF